MQKKTNCHLKIPTENRGSADYSNGCPKPAAQEGQVTERAATLGPCKPIRRVAYLNPKNERFESEIPRQRTTQRRPWENPVQQQ